MSQKALMEWAEKVELVRRCFYNLQFHSLLQSVQRIACKISMCSTAIRKYLHNVHRVRVLLTFSRKTEEEVHEFRPFSGGLSIGCIMLQEVPVIVSTPSTSLSNNYPICHPQVSHILKLKFKRASCQNTVAKLLHRKSMTKQFTSPTVYGESIK